MRSTSLFPTEPCSSSKVAAGAATLHLLCLKHVQASLYLEKGIAAPPNPRFYIHGEATPFDPWYLFCFFKKI